MKDKILEITDKLKSDEITSDEAQKQLLCLFGVMPRWVSVNDRLPDKLQSGQYVTVLVVYNGKVTTASWLFGKFCLSHNGCSDIQPTHWSYMIEPPNVA